MDRVKAIKVLKPLIDSYVDYANISMKEEDDDIVEALEMAVEALDVPDTNVGDMIDRQAALDIYDDYNVAVENGELEAYGKHRKRLLGLSSAQPATNCSEIPNGSDDTISRQAAIDALDEQIEQCNKALGSFDISPKDEYAIKVERASLEAYKEQLENMSSAQPERKKDEWIPISKETNPTKSGWYLVTVHAEFNATNGMWYDIDEPTNMYLRWMPLPEPYRG